MAFGDSASNWQSLCCWLPAVVCCSVSQLQYCSRAVGLTFKLDSNPYAIQQLGVQRRNSSQLVPWIINWVQSFKFGDVFADEELCFAMTVDPRFKIVAFDSDERRKRAACGCHYRSNRRRHWYESTGWPALESTCFSISQYAAVIVVQVWPCFCQWWSVSDVSFSRCIASQVCELYARAQNRSDVIAVRRLSYMILMMIFDQLVIVTVARCRLHFECIAHESDIWYVNNRFSRGRD